MQVDILNQNEGISRAILKLYDVRFADQLREDYGVLPWTQDHAASVFKLIQSGEAARLLYHFDKDIRATEFVDNWTSEQKEVYLHHWCIEMCNQEKAVYDELREYQGSRIPRLFDFVTLSIDPEEEPTALRKRESEGLADKSAENGEFLKVPGILVEYIPGFTLSQLADRGTALAPEGSFQAIVDEAVENVRLFSDHNLVNEDTRLSNVIVSRDPALARGYRVASIDFAQCQFRRADESDMEWGRRKWNEDEEGEIGMVMKHRLAELGYLINYSPSNRYLTWAEAEDDEANTT